jgi:YVTN family beta-propeller protein
LKKWKVSKKLVMAALATLILGSGSVYAAYNLVAGPQANGTGVTPHGWTLTPAGTQLSLGDFPMGGVLSPDHRYLVVSNDGQGTQSLQVVDIEKQQVIQTIPYQNGEGLYLGTAFSPDGKKLYASAGGNNKIRVFSFDHGTLTEQAPIMMKDQNNTNFTPMGISISPDGKFLYVANNGANSVSKIDLSTGQIVATRQVGKDPYTTWISHDGNALYVSNWGESSVTVLNPNDLTVTKTISVGLHPNAITENPVTGLVYVSDSDSDQISVIDPKQEQVVQTISLAPYKGALPGSQPVALTVSPDGKTLYVANAGNDDIAVIDLGDGTIRSEVKVKGLIPTAWYPSGVYTDGKKLMVLNAKGLGAGPNTQHQYIGNMMQGTMSFIDIPDEKQLKKYTEQVKENNQVNKAEGDGWLSELKGDKDFPIPRFADQHSPIKHVIYVIKENRTYDQVFGDMGKGNGDPSLVQFGKNITPNIHKLANQFVLLDNFYCDGEVSDPGHQWATAGESNDYSEKTWLPDYSGRKVYGVDIPALKPKNGYLWDNAKRSGVSFRDYGEYINYWESPTNNKWIPDDPGIGNNYDPNYPGWDLSISDMTRYNEWEKEFKKFEQNDNLPQLEMVYLPNDHTAGTTPGQLTPQAMVAQNDLALGKLVDTVSHSKYWKDTAIFVVEDDPQDGLDHVDAHRTEALVISPYTQKGTVDSTLYDQVSMIRTIELILGMKPMNQFDASAIPMLNAFTNHPNFTPYTVEQPTYPLDAKNGQKAPMAQDSQKMDFSKPDSADHDKLNRAIWKATKGDQPYPKQNHE